MAKKRHMIFLEDEQFSAMEEIKEESGTPIAEQIRRAVTAYLEAKKK